MLDGYPDAKKHQLISFIKSGLRFVGYFALPFSLMVAAVFLILAEVLGVVEELV
jgi:hypothetical protein